MKTLKDKPLGRIGWESVRKSYGPKMLKAMTQLRARLTAELPNLTTDEPFEMDCDRYSVYLRLHPKGKESVDVEFSIEDSADYEGLAGGYTFRVDIVEEGGRIVGEFSPYNYSEQVWCKTRAEIRERFDLFPAALLADSMVEFVAENVGEE